MKETDIIIIGVGPTGFFAVFEAGLLRLKCHLIDTLPQVGGQLTELYPKKPIFDIPGYPSVGASELIDNLMEQIKQFQPEFTLGETAIALTKNNDDTFIVTTDKGTQIKGKAVAIAGGLGTLLPTRIRPWRPITPPDIQLAVVTKSARLFKDSTILLSPSTML